jgi:predicted RNA-binding protein with PUA-like domain
LAKTQPPTRKEFDENIQSFLQHLHIVKQDRLCSRPHRGDAVQMSVKYWLMKSEPDVYSIDHLKKDRSTWWNGVRNYQARNFMSQEMKVGDWVLFYHSSAEPPGVAGLAQVCQAAKPDETQFDSKNEYFDPKATREKPNWFCVQVQFVEKFKNLVSLSELRAAKSLKEMMVLKKGQRLSIQPLSEKEFLTVKKMGG